MKKILAVALAVVLCMALFAGCVRVDKDLESVVGTVDGKKITQAEFNFVYKMIYDQMSTYAMDYGENWINMEIDENGTTLSEQMKTNVFQQLSYFSAVCKFAEKEFGIKTNDDDVQKSFKKLKDDFVKNAEEGYDEYLKKSRTTDEAVDDYLLKCAVFEKVNKKLTEKGGPAYVDDKTLFEEFSQSNWKVKHILIGIENTDANGNKTPVRSFDEALVIANDVIAKIEEGADFDSLIKEYDDDPGMDPGGFYTFTTGQMVPEFEEASRNLAVGDFTKEAVKTDYGYHIIKKYEITADDENFVKFKAQTLDQKVNEILEPLAKQVKVERKNDVLNPYIDKWIKELSK